MNLDALAKSARDDFVASVTQDAQAYLACKMTAAEFAGSVWYAAGTAALTLGDGRSRWLGQWLPFAHWEDDLDNAPDED